MNYIIEIAPLLDYFVVAVKDKNNGELKETFTLNESGVDMLRLYTEGKDIMSITKEIAELYDAPIELVSTDIINFAEKLRKKGLVE